MEDLNYRIANIGDAEKINDLFSESIKYHESFDSDINQNWPTEHGLEYFRKKISDSFVMVCESSGGALFLV